MWILGGTTDTLESKCELPLFKTLYFLSLLDILDLKDWMSQNKNKDSDVYDTLM